MKSAGLAQAILDKQGVSSEAAEPVGSVAYDTAFDEFWGAVDKKDKSSAKRTLRAILDMEKAEAGG